MIGVIGIIGALFMVVALTVLGLNVIVSALLSTFLVIFTNALPVEEAFSSSFLGGCATIVSSMFGLMLAGMILGEVYTKTGAVKSIALSITRLFKGKDGHISKSSTIISVFVAGFLFCYGGIQLVPVTFILTPIAYELCRDADIPRKLVPGIVYGAIATYALSGPGSPQIQNSLPGTILGTSSTAALIPGLVAALICIVGNYLFLNYSANRLSKKGEHFTPKPKEDAYMTEDEQLPNPVLSFIPLLVIFILYNFFKLYVVFAVFIGTLLALILFWPAFDKKISNIVKVCGDACVQTGYLIMAAAVMGGLATVISTTPAFSSLLEALPNMNMHPNFVAMISTIIIVAFTGSGPTAIGISLPLFAPTFQAMGMNMAALHRITSLSVMTLDTLPTNAIYIAVNEITQLKTRETYPYIFVTTVFMTTLAALAATTLLTLFPGLA